MGDQAQFLDYMELQGTNDMVTKTELLEEVRTHGRSISDRTLTYYTSQGLIPGAVRVGSRAGAYPRVVVELLCWIVGARDRGLSVDALRELLPPER